MGKPSQPHQGPEGHRCAAAGRGWDRAAPHRPGLAERLGLGSAMWGAFPGRAMNAAPSFRSCDWGL